MLVKNQSYHKANPVDPSNLINLGWDVALLECTRPMLLGARTLLGAPGLTTRSKHATRSDLLGSTGALHRTSADR